MSNGWRPTIAAVPRALQAITFLYLCYLALPLVVRMPSDPRLGSARRALEEAQRLREVGQYAEAVPFVERALAIQEEVLGRNDSEVANSLNELGVLYLFQGLPARAEPPLQRALGIFEASLGKGHPNAAAALNNLASAYVAQGRYEDAEPLLERALASLEAALGKGHLDVAAALKNLADAYVPQRRYEQAEPLLRRALAIREAALGPDHLDVAYSLDAVSHLYATQRLYSRSEPLDQRALAIRERALGQGHPEVATSLTRLAYGYVEEERYSQAEPLLRRALAIREAAFGESHPDVASALNELGVLYQRQELYAQAEPFFQRALTIRERILGPGHPTVASALNNLATIYEGQGLHEQAEPLFQRAITIAEAAWGKDHLEVATMLHNLTTLYMRQGLYARAEPLLQRMLAIEEGALGQDHPNVVGLLDQLASLYVAVGLYTRAEHLLQRALASREATGGKYSMEVAPSLIALADLYVRQRLHARAEPLLKRALGIFELWNAASGQYHPGSALLANDLGVVYLAMGLYKQAEPLLRYSLAMKEEGLGPAHPEVASALHTLANLYEEQGLYKQAEPLLQRALALREAVFGKDHPGVAEVLDTLARNYMRQELSARGEPLRKRALAIWEATLRKDLSNGSSLLAVGSTYMRQGLHEQAEPLLRYALASCEAASIKDDRCTVASLTELALIRVSQQRLSEALPLLARAFTLSEESLRKDVYAASEVQLAHMLHRQRTEEGVLYELAQMHPDNARVRHLALSTALLRKARSVEEVASTSRTIYRGLGQEDRAAFERLRALRTQFSTLSLSGPGTLSPAAHQQRLEELADKVDALEADLARRSAPLRERRAQPPPLEISDRVAAALPKDGALVELVAYRDGMLAPDTRASRPPRQLRYLALLLFADGRTRAVDLGPAEPIDRAALRLHDVLARGDVSYQPPAHALYQLAFRPLVPLLGKVRRLFLSPDGQLALVPFAALHDGQRFLIDTWDISYLTSGKDLLPRSQGIPPERSVMILADPDFSAPSSGASAEPRPAAVSRSDSLEHLFSSLRANLADQFWPPLPGTRKEAEAIQRLLPQAQLLLGSAATKEALLRLDTPGILHIATHGFFLEDASVLLDTRAVGHFGVIGRVSSVSPSLDPLLRSGLVLAGAHASAAQHGSYRHEDSLVTALELAGLDLWGTQLVVLSACDTGRGDIRLGQGVYGMRRALTVAGAETLVTSLWKINDAVTSQLMEAYYRQLLAGQGRTTALRQAMQTVRLEQPHPHFWAPFIALGLDAPLQGLARR